MTNGGIIGLKNNTSSTSASGVWGLKEQHSAVKNNKWPFGIVTDNLILHLDAGDSVSYPGSGTTWFDIGGTIGNYTLENSPTFTTNYFTLNGINHKFLAETLDRQTANNFTYSIWAMPTATHEIDTQSSSSTAGVSGQRYLMAATFGDVSDSGAGISCGTNGVSVYEHSGGYMPPLLVSTTPISGTVPTLITVVYQNKTPSLYLNGVFDKTGLTSPKPNVRMFPLEIGGHQYGYFQGRIYACHLYSKALSFAEIQQNFNALRGRYGI